jgi:PAS domain-containing protein
MIFFLDPDGIVRLVNPATERIMGFGSGEAVRRTGTESSWRRRHARSRSMGSSSAWRGSPVT